jgi:hypothetical protein
MRPQTSANGDLEDIRPDEVVDLRREEGRFIIVESDRCYRMTLDGQRFDWPGRVVSGGLLRKLGQVPAENAIYLERTHEPDRPLGDHDLVDLDGPGVESFVSRKLVWKLNVQGEAPAVLWPDHAIDETARVACQTASGRRDGSHGTT